MTILEAQLKEAKEEITMLEERCKELTQKEESTEQSLVSQHIAYSVEQKTWQSELEEKKKEIKELENTIEEIIHQTFEQSEVKKPGEKGTLSLIMCHRLIWISLHLLLK
ncbi:filensin-like [Ptychodera flava]|uniref:filensin-like n=1 Tax=Ptychodera flava TaxID=63121 RepID=UPI003969DE6B